MRIFIFVCVFFISSSVFAQDYAQQGFADMQTEQDHQHDQLFQQQLDMQRQEHEELKRQELLEETNQAIQSMRWKQEYEERTGSN